MKKPPSTPQKKKGGEEHDILRQKTVLLHLHQKTVHQKDQNQYVEPPGGRKGDKPQGYPGAEEMIGLAGSQMGKHIRGGYAEKPHPQSPPGICGEEKEKGGGEKGKEKVDQGETGMRRELEGIEKRCSQKGSPQSAEKGPEKAEGTEGGHPGQQRRKKRLGKHAICGRGEIPMEHHGGDTPRFGKKKTPPKIKGHEKEKPSGDEQKDCFYTKTTF